MHVRITDNTHSYCGEQYTQPIRFLIGDDMKIGSRIEAEMKRLSWSEGELARRAGVSQPTVHRIIKGESKSPRHENIQAIAKAFGCAPEWLWTGAGKPPAGAPAPLPVALSAADQVKKMLEEGGRGLPEDIRQRIAATVAEPFANQPGEQADQSNVIVADFSRRPLIGDEIRIAHYDVQGAMGNGKQVHDFPELFRDVTVSQQHLRELGVKYQDPRHLKMITGHGQSMAPTIEDKDPMIVDASIREFTGDGIYAFTWQGLFYIKRLQMKGAEHFKMISDNALHSPEEIRVDETYIQARVLLVWNAKRV